MNSKVPQDAICNLWLENWPEKSGKNAEWDEVRKIPRQAISPVSDKSPGFQGDPTISVDSSNRKLDAEMVWLDSYPEGFPDRFRYIFFFWNEYAF